MKKLFKLILTMILAFSICFGSVSISSYAADNPVNQKQAAKKLKKYVKKHFKSNDILDWDIKYHKSGKRYVFTLTVVTKQVSENDMKRVAFYQDQNYYQDMIRELTKKSKQQYQKAKKFGLKKPIFRFRPIL